MESIHKDSALKLIRFMRKFGSLKFANIEDATPTEVDAILHIGLIDSIDGAASPGAVAERMHISPSQLSQLLRSLDEHGFVVRARSAKDSRKVVLKLTDAGQEIFQKVDSSFVETVNDVIDFLGYEEAVAFYRTLLKLLEYVDGREEAGGDAR